MRTELIDIIKDTWQQLLDEEIEATALYAVDGFSLAACIHIVGEWQGAATIVMENHVAEHVAAGMFNQAPTELNELQIADALGELANIIGGLVKSGLDGQNLLSLPVVVRGGIDIIGSERVFIQGFETPAGQFEVGLYTHSKEWAEKVMSRFS